MKARPQRREVVIVQRRLTDYRVPLFEALKAKLAAADLSLRLLHGPPTEEEAMKRDAGELDWAEPLPARYLLSGRICWQPFGRQTRDAELVIVTQENKLLYNLCALTLARPRRIAFWGHGGNLQSSRPDGLREGFKRWTTCRVDWWFAYTGLSVDLVRTAGFPEARITNLENAIDTSGLRALCDAVTDPEIDGLRGELGLVPGQTALYLGSLYAEKRLDFLIRCGGRLAERIPGFRLVVAGDGPLRGVVRAEAERHPWLRYVGPRRGRDKAVLLRVADVFLNPGLVGLGILDTFVAGVPLITTDCGLHSPEIAYLRNGGNGFITEDSEDAFCAAARRVLSDPALAQALGMSALADSRRYTIENMAERFAGGIVQCMDSTPRPGGAE